MFRGLQTRGLRGLSHQLYHHPTTPVLPRPLITAYVPLRTNYSSPRKPRTPVCVSPSRRPLDPPSDDHGIVPDVQLALASPNVSVQLRGVMRHMVHSVVIVTSCTSSDPTDWRAMTISSFTTLSLDPNPLVTFNIRVPSACAKTMHARNRFIIHAMLPTPRAADFAARFSQPYVPGQDWKYTNRPNSYGVPVATLYPGEKELLLRDKDFTESEIKEILGYETKENETIVLTNGKFGRIPISVDESTDNLPSLQEEVMFRLYCVPERTIRVQDHEIWVAKVERIEYPSYPHQAYGIEPHAPLSLLYGDRSFREAGLHMVEAHNKLRRWVRRKMTYEMELKEERRKKLERRLKRSRDARERARKEREESMWGKESYFVQKHGAIKREGKVQDEEYAQEENDMPSGKAQDLEQSDVTSHEHWFSLKRLRRESKKRTSDVGISPIPYSQPPPSPSSSSDHPQPSNLLSQPFSPRRKELNRPLNSSATFRPPMSRNYGTLVRRVTIRDRPEISVPSGSSETKEMKYPHSTSKSVPVVEEQEKWIYRQGISVPVSMPTKQLEFSTQSTLVDKEKEIRKSKYPVPPPQPIPKKKKKKKQLEWDFDQDIWDDPDIEWQSIEEEEPHPKQGMSQWIRGVLTGEIEKHRQLKEANRQLKQERAVISGQILNGGGKALEVRSGEMGTDQRRERIEDFQSGRSDVSQDRRSTDYVPRQSSPSDVSQDRRSTDYVPRQSSPRDYTSSPSPRESQMQTQTRGPNAPNQELEFWKEKILRKKKKEWGRKMDAKKRSSEPMRQGYMGRGYVRPQA